MIESLVNRCGVLWGRITKGKANKKLDNSLLQKDSPNPTKNHPKVV